ncbi:hypothetical protein [Neorhizobium sp. T7_12]|uniref:hypothetical protein n=1 Tax=Neorhizobium sp. T7_12 TaxID=2093832 RepID=UPI00352D74FA
MTCWPQKGGDSFALAKCVCMEAAEGRGDPVRGCISFQSGRERRGHSSLSVRRPSPPSVTEELLKPPADPPQTICVEREVPWRLPIAPGF